MKIFVLVLTLLCALSVATGQVPSGTRHYFFLSDRRIVTVELIDAQKAILNYINLGDTFEIIQAPMLLFLDSTDRPHRGHVIQIENPSDPAKLFKVTALIKPGQYEGYSILGRYDFQSPPQKAFFKVSSRIIELEPVSEEDFELLAARIGELDLSIKSGKQMVLGAGFHRGHGLLYSAGTEEAEELEKYFPDSDLELLAPVLLSAPQPALPSSFADLPDPVIVQLSAFVSRSGGVHRVRVMQGINPKLDELAVDTVQNSWTFLPAISKGEIANTQLTLNVVFRRK